MAAAKQAKTAPHLALGTMEFGRGECLEEQSTAMVEYYLAQGHVELDTAFMYCDGKTEEILGRMACVSARPELPIATKANPFGPGGSLKPERVEEQMTTSLARLHRESVDLFYLHAPDHRTPIEVTLGMVQKLYEGGKFKRFGLSNYAAWQVTEIYYICKSKGWVLPTVYQGMYNAFTRDVERELFHCLRALGISFYAYNPLAGGLLTDRYHYEDLASKPQGRFFNSSAWDKIYRDRFWKEENFKALELVRAAVQAAYGGTVTTSEAALRWMMHHSRMDGAKGDALILGASKMAHLQANMAACAQGPLEPAVVEAFEKGWEITRPVCIQYFR